MLQLLLDSMNFESKVYSKAFCNSPDAKCAFIARDEKRIENQAQNFAEAIQRKTGAHLLTIDVAQYAAKEKTPLTAVYEELCLLASREGIAIPADKQSRALAVKEMSKMLSMPATEEIAPTPIVYFKHFQYCILPVRTKGIAEYLFLRELPCKLVISANMGIIEIEKSIVPIGSASILSPVLHQITIENDVPFRSYELSKACVAI